MTHSKSIWAVVLADLGLAGAMLYSILLAVQLSKAENPHQEIDVAPIPSQEESEQEPEPDPPTLLLTIDAEGRLARPPEDAFARLDDPPAQLQRSITEALAPHPVDDPIVLAVDRSLSFEHIAVAIGYLGSHVVQLRFDVHPTDRTTP